MKIVALVPMRGGSKSIPRKNIKVIAGKPLFYWAITAAYESKCFEEIWVSTEDEEIKKTVKRFTPFVKIMHRSPELAEDDTSTEAVMLDFSNKIDFDILATIQVTSPLVQKEDYIQALKEFQKGDFDSLFTGVVFKRFLWNSQCQALNYSPDKRPRRQEMDDFYLENGAFYFTKRDILKEQKNRLGGNITCHVMKDESAVEIDDPCDWKIVENLLLPVSGQALEM